MEDGKNTDQVNVTVNKATRILYFSDGAYEEVEENEVDHSKPEACAVDPQTLSWGPWVSYYAWSSGTKVLNAVDYVGETLADFFGITTPKYQLEISEYERLQEEKRKLDEESAGWSHSGGDIPLVLSEPPSKMVNQSDNTS